LSFVFSAVGVKKACNDRFDLLEKLCQF